MPLETLPQQKRIFDFFPEENPDPRRKKRGAAKKDDKKKLRHRVSTYLTDKQYKQFIAYCEKQEMYPAEAIRLAIRTLIADADR